MRLIRLLGLQEGEGSCHHEALIGGTLRSSSCSSVRRFEAARSVGATRRRSTEASLVNDYEAKIAALERKVGQLTMELDLLKKTPSLRLVSNSEKCSIISGPKAAPSEGGAK